MCSCIKSLTIVNILSHLKRFIFDENPIAAIFIVYNPVFTIIPARIDSTPNLVCKNAVTNPDIIPAPIARNSPRNGCPCKVTIAQTAQPRVKQPSVERSAIFNILNDTKSARTTSEYINPSSNALCNIEIVKIEPIFSSMPYQARLKQRA